MIYFVQAEGTNYVKIGYTGGEPKKRMAELQTGCPHKLALVASIEGDEQDEARWHAEYKHLKGNGEWFEFTPRLITDMVKAVVFDRFRIRARSARQLVPLVRRGEIEDATGLTDPPSLFTDKDHVHDERFDFPIWWPDFMGIFVLRWPALASHLIRATGCYYDPRIRGEDVSDFMKSYFKTAHFTLVVPDEDVAIRVSHNQIIGAELDEYISDTLQMSCPRVKVKACFRDDNEEYGVKHYHFDDFR